jgi:hypothetical protein
MAHHCLVSRDDEAEEPVLVIVGRLVIRPAVAGHAATAGAADSNAATCA